MSVETGAHEPARDACRDAVSGVWPIHVRLSAHRMRPSNTTAPSCAKHYWSLGSDHFLCCKKLQKTIAADAMPGVYTVYYHEGFTGRAQPLEMMLAASKATNFCEWKRAPWNTLDDPTCFAAPAVAHDQTKKVISQTTAAAQ